MTGDETAPGHPLSNKGTRWLVGSWFIRFSFYEENRFPKKTLHRLSIEVVKMPLITEKIEKAHNVRNFFSLTRSTTFPPFLRA